MVLQRLVGHDPIRIQERKVAVADELLMNGPFFTISQASAIAPNRKRRIIWDCPALRVFSISLSD
jgi:hypothetical protein